MSARHAVWIGVLALLLAVVARPVAVAGQVEDYAGLVVRHGDGRVTYAYVPLTEGVSGIELLKRSGVSLVTVGFGGLGDAVCSIDGTGCEVGECRQRVCQEAGSNSPYWRYFRQSSPGTWEAMALGGSSTRVTPGQIDGWSWTPDEPKLPAVTIEELPGLAGTTAGAPEASRATYSAGGELVAQSESERSLVVYGAIAVILGSLAVAGVVVNRSRVRARVETP